MYLLTICLALSTSFLTQKNHAEQTAPLFTGLRAVELFARLGVDVEYRGVGRRGVAYDDVRISVIHEQQGEASRGKRRPEDVQTARDLGVQISSLSLSVSPSLLEAAQLFTEAKFRISVGPTHLCEFLGDDRAVWSFNPEDGATFLVRWKNLVVGFSWVEGLDDGIAFVRRMEKIILEDSTTAPLGRFTDMPRISKSWFSSGLTPGATVRVAPKVEGFARADGVRFAIHAVQGNPLSTQNNDGSLSFRVPPLMSWIHLPADIGEEHRSNSMDRVRKQPTTVRRRLNLAGEVRKGHPTAELDTEQEQLTLILVAADSMNLLVRRRIDVARRPK